MTATSINPRSKKISDLQQLVDNEHEHYVVQNGVIIKVLQRIEALMSVGLMQQAQRHQELMAEHKMGRVSRTQLKTEGGTKARTTVVDLRGNKKKKKSPFGRNASASASGINCPCIAQPLTLTLALTLTLTSNNAG